jgi:hypothetical protein
MNVYGTYGMGYLLVTYFDSKRPLYRTFIPGGQDDIYVRRKMGELIVASVYRPYNSEEPPPTKEVRDVIDYCSSRKKQLIIGCDANAHILWGSTNTNPGGVSFMEYLVSSNLNILNQGNEPTFVIRNRKEVIDLPLGTNRIGNLVSN